MPPYLLISIVIFVLLILVALVAIALRYRATGAESDLAMQQKHSQGYWVSLGISIGAGSGVVLGIVFDNLALGLAIGVAMGVAIGAALEQKYKGRVRPLTPEERKMRKGGVAFGLFMLVAGVGVFAFILLLINR